ncbi:MAG TPA: hypothetical protein VLH79_15405 [Chthonomonadales bacterium]|nr:hypothetical protein [Chthonomonadales bacterium]
MARPVARRSLLVDDAQVSCAHERRLWFEVVGWTILDIEPVIDMLNSIGIHDVCVPMSGVGDLERALVTVGANGSHARPRGGGPRRCRGAYVGATRAV